MWLKAIAVTSAVALGGGYVAWKDAQAKNARIDALEKRIAAWEDAENDVTLMVGSKSPGRDVLNFEQVQIPGIPIDEALMPSSKSGLIFPPDPASNTQDPAILIPSSKSLSPVFELPEQEQEEKEEQP